MRNQRYKKWKRQKLRLEQNIPKEILKVKNKGFSFVNVPSEFSFIKNTKKVLEVIDRIDILLKQRKKTFVNLESVTEIDNGAITVLLSKMTEYKLENVDFNGIIPRNKMAKALLFSSGFFDHLYSNISKNLFDDTLQNAYGKANQIITKPGKKVIPNIAKWICESVSNTLNQDNMISTKGLYRTLIELMHNTNNHAMFNKKGEELWWLSVHHDRQKKKVSFVFLDFGVGIFESLRNKPETSAWNGIYMKIKERISIGTDARVLELILKGELHKTSTELKHRGKGLSGIYEVNKKEQIENLNIITNNVFANVNENKYKMLDCNFSGTFVYWEMNGKE